MVCDGDQTFSSSALKDHLGGSNDFTSYFVHSLHCCFFVSDRTAFDGRSEKSEASDQVSQFLYDGKGEGKIFYFQITKSFQIDSFLRLANSSIGDTL